MNLFRWMAETQGRGSLRWEESPILRKENLRRILSSLNIPTSLPLYWSPTGGSTSETMYIPCTLQENQRMRRVLGEWMHRCRFLWNRKTVFSLFTSNRMYRSLELLQDLTHYCETTYLPVGADCPREAAVALYHRFRPDCIMGSTSTLIGFAQHCQSVLPRAEDRSASTVPKSSSVSFKHCIFASEPLEQNKMLFLKDAFNIERFGSVFGSAETGTWGFCCDVEEWTLMAILAGFTMVKTVDEARISYFVPFLYPRELVHLEVHDFSVRSHAADSQFVPAPPGQFGELICTNLVSVPFVALDISTQVRNHVLPIVRYATGDIAKVATIDETRTFLEAIGYRPSLAENLGVVFMTKRGFGSFKIDQNLYDYENFESICRKVLGRNLLDVQLHISFVPTLGRDRLLTKLLVRSSLSRRLREKHSEFDRIAEKCRDAYRHFMYHEANNCVLEFQFLDSDSELACHPISHKRLRIVDSRD